MRPITSEWVEKAEEDRRVAARELNAEPPGYNTACFHAQQCVEKYLKALLQENEIPFFRTHDLEALLKLCLPVMQELGEHREDLRWLTSFAVEIRYPGMNAGRQDAERCVSISEAFYTLVRSRLK